MSHTISRISATFLCAAALTVSASAVANAHFYKPPKMFCNEPAAWFGNKRGKSAQDWRTQLDASYAAGSTRTMYNDNGTKTNILNPNGPENLLYLAEGITVRGGGLGNYLNALASDPRLLAGRGAGTFGQVELNGKFVVNEFNLNWRQNLRWGLFLDAHLPIRTTKLEKISYTDLSPASGNAGYNQSNPQWRALLTNLDALFQLYGYSTVKTSYSKTDAGDLSLLLGWDRMLFSDNNNFLACTIKGGALLPTGSLQQTSHAITIPFDNNHNIGLHGFVQLHAGIAPWLTMRMHGSLTHFLEGESKNVRIRTNPLQGTFLLLEQQNVKQQLGNLWHLGTDLSFDHVVGGLSARVGYSYSQQEASSITPALGAVGRAVPVKDANPSFRSWQMHTIHLMTDYDVSVHLKDKRVAPRIAFFYNLPVDGKNAFKTEMLGGNVGLDIRWKI